MAKNRFVCHRCRHKWKIGRDIPKECPKCGHANVGWTDPARGVLKPLIALVVLALAGAWYLELLPGSAQDAIDDGLEQVQDKVDETRRDLESLDDERPGRRPGKGKPSKPKAEGTPKGDAPSKPKPKPKPRPTEPKGDEPPPPKPDVVIKSKSAAAQATSYWVKGKVENKGGADATGVRVTVTFKDGSGARVSKVKATCPSSLGAGETARYEAAVAGDDASRVESFEVDVAFDE